MADVKNFMVGFDTTTVDQINKFANSIAYRDSKIRIMPDAHAGKGAVIGSTMTYSDKIVPATVGVDIACRVTAFNVGSLTNLDLYKLDEICRNRIPTGSSVRQNEHEDSLIFPYESLYCWENLKNHDRLRKSMGTLGGGNHYIELDRDKEKNEYWLVIHSGSRNLGKQVAEYYQDLALEERENRIQNIKKYLKDDITYLRKTDAVNLIQKVIDISKSLINAEPSDDLCYITGENMNHYLHDMRICNNFSFHSHMVIFKEIANNMNWDSTQHITCIHNYVDVDHNIIRKGAIAGYGGQMGLIPLNMRDGILVVKALGNQDWNCSLPHGAGRIMSRGQAHKKISLKDFQTAMKGIVSSSVVKSTLDESPMAYKDAQAIIDAIRPNAKILIHMYPVWNFKAK